MGWWDEVRVALRGFLHQHGVCAGFVMMLIQEAGVPVTLPPGGEGGRAPSPVRGSAWAAPSRSSISRAANGVLELDRGADVHFVCSIRC